MDKVVLYSISLVFGGVGAWVIARWGNKLSLLDRPNERSSHGKVVPKGGGIGILAAFLVSSPIISFPASFWVPAAVLALFSLWGDRWEISPKIRLLIQFSAAAILLAGVLWDRQSEIRHYILMVPLAVFVVGTANYYNFMDGINGIAGITGIVGFGLVAFFASLSGYGHAYVTLAICMSLSCLGFLPFNMPKARVFMGDVGSVLLGFVFAGMAVALSKNILDFVCLASFLFPFYADELSTMAVRIKDGENLLHPHRRHIYQLLANEKGIAHWKVSVGYGLLQLVVGLSVLAVRDKGLFPVLGVLVIYFAGFCVAGHRIRSTDYPG